MHLRTKFHHYFGLGAFWLSISCACAGSAPQPLSISEPAWELSTTALMLNLSNLAQLGCLTPKSKSEVTNLYNSTGQALNVLHKEYSDYMLVVSKKMNGEGSCNGGFESIAKESDLRATRSKQARDRLGKIQSYVASNNAAHFVAPEISVTNSKGKKCYKVGTAYLNQLPVQMTQVSAGFTQMQNSATLELENFSKYSEQNLTLADKCGATDPSAHQNAAPLLKTTYARGKGTPAKSGVSRNPSSDITGTSKAIRDESAANQIIDGHH